MLLAALALASALAPAGQGLVPPAETVTVRSRGLSLRALLWRPPGRGPFPAVIFN